MKKTSSLPLTCIVIAFLYSLTHLSTINQITAQTFLDVLQLFYAIFFWIFLFSIAKNYGVFEWIGHLFYPLLHPLLLLNPTEIAIYLASIFSGYPTFAKIIHDSSLPQDRQCHLLRFCSHPSLGFVIVTLGEGIFQEIKIGYILFFIQVFSNLIIAILFKAPSNSSIHEISYKTTSPISLIKQQFKASFEVFIYIFGFMLVFRIISQMLPIHSVFLSGLLEFSQGCLNSTHYNLKIAFILCSFFLSFSSLSVICQALSLLDNVITIKAYLKGRLLQATISSLMALVISNFLF